MLPGIVDSILRPIHSHLPRTVPGGFLSPDDDISQCPGGGFFPPEYWQSDWVTALEGGGLGDALEPSIEWDPSDCFSAVGHFAD